MRTFWINFVQFFREIILFGLDAFVVAASKEVTKRFWIRLTSRGGSIAVEGATEDRSRYLSSSSSSASRQRDLPFLDEYRD